MPDTPVPDAPATITVKVRDHAAESPWGSGLTNPHVRSVTISANCPVCGGPRGTPRSVHQSEDGEHYWVEVWANACGHLDAYADVVSEARTLEAAREDLEDSLAVAQHQLEIANGTVEYISQEAIDREQGITRASPA